MSRLPNITVLFRLGTSDAVGADRSVLVSLPVEDRISYLGWCLIMQYFEKYNAFRFILVDF